MTAQPHFAEPNAPWVNRILHTNWAALERLVGPTWMPAETDQSSGRRRAVHEYGCGHYGCVAPTVGADGIVFKLTSDRLEAHFIAAAMSLKEFPEGIVRYHRIVQVEGTHLNRPVFAVWREEAFHVGLLNQVVGESRRRDPLFREHPDLKPLAREERDALLLFMSRLFHFKQWAGLFKVAIGRTKRPLPVVLAEMKRYHAVARQNLELDHLEDTSWAREPGVPLGRKLAFYHRACELIVEMMVNESGAHLVSRALEFYLDHGLLLADVHTGNIGEVAREDYENPIWAITDPGHAVPLDERFAAVVVPAL